MVLPQNTELYVARKYKILGTMVLLYICELIVPIITTTIIKIIQVNCLHGNDKELHTDN